ncbi:unnamed protein product [Closterium sp. NIES-53]
MVTSLRGGEFSSDILRAFYRVEGIRQTFTLLASPQQNGIAERRIGMVMDVPRTSMIHAAAPHFLWPFAVQYAAHQINLQPRVSLPETTPTLRWTGKVGDASTFRVWGSRAFVRNTSADKLSSRAVPFIFLGFPPDAPGWQFYHPTSRCVLSSQDVTFDESVSYYCLFPYRAASLPPPATLPSTRGSLGVPLWREPLSPQRLREWYARRCRDATGAAGVGATGGGAGTSAVGGVAGAAGGAIGARTAGRAAGAGAAGGATGAGAAGGAARAGAAGGAAGARATGGAAGAGATGGTAGAGATGGAACTGVAGAAGPGGARPGGTVVTEAGGATGVVTRDPGVEGTGAVSANFGGAARPRPYYVLLLQQVFGLPPSPGPTPPSPQPAQSLSQLLPSSPLPAPSPYSGPTRGLTERRE